MLTPITTPAFFHAGKATFTVAGPTKHYTFQAVRPKAKPGQPTPPVFLKVLAGADNNDDGSYKYVGILANDGRVIITRKSTFTQDSQAVKVAAWAVSHVIAGQPLPAGYIVHHCGKCAACGRKLTTPTSVSLGFGPDCAADLGLKVA